MTYSLIFQVVTILQLILGSFGQSILQEIYNTQQLISLYQQKLTLLLEMAQMQNITIPQFQNFTKSIKKTSKNSIFKIQQQIIFESDIYLVANSQYIHPNYVINETSVVDLNDKSRVFKFIGQIIGFETLQITTRISDEEIIIYKLTDNFVQNRIKIKLRNQFGRWHHATQFEDIFLQYEQDTLTLTSQKQTKTYKFKSQIIKIFSIHQYKILFVTRYSYGYLNPKSFEVGSQTQFDSIVQSCYYNSMDGTLLILFNNRNLVVYLHDNAISKQIIPPGVIITNNMEMDYLGGNYLFLYENGVKCFNIFEISAPSYLLTHNRQICPSQKFRSDKLLHSEEKPFYKYKFFKNHESYKFLLTDNLTQTKLYVINLKQKQAVSERSFPWKALLIVLCIVGVVYFRLNKSNSKNRENSQQKIRSIKKVKKSNPNANMRPSSIQNQQEDQQYIQSLNNEIKRMRSLKQQKKIN